MAECHISLERTLNEQATQEDRAELRERLGLNDGFLTQYVRFVSNAAHGEFGISYRNQQDVKTLIAERFPATLELVLMATIISLIVGIPLGVITAVHQDSRLANLCNWGQLLVCRCQVLSWASC